MSETLDLRFFFESTLGAEEVSSALVATLLDGRPDFLEYFLDQVDEPRALPRTRWRTRIESPLESGRIDIRMDHPDGHVLLVENKVRSSSMQPGQLLGYCLALQRQHPCGRVQLVYLAPGATGASEVAQVVEKGGLSRDQCVQLSWERLAEYRTRLHPDDACGWFIASGFEQVLQVIRRDKIEKYPLLGGREVVDSIAKAARERLLTFGLLDFQSVWRSRGHSEIASQGGSVTLWLHLLFEADPEPPYAPRNLTRNGLVHLGLRAMFKLSDKARKVKERWERWSPYIKAGHVEVPDVGRFELRERGWFEHVAELEGTEERLASDVAGIGERVMRSLVAHL
ncbi:MAG: PD-(D/E)XK nuclease family protein [Pseudomonadota bacterium]